MVSPLIATCQPYVVSLAMGGTSSCWSVHPAPVRTQTRARSFQASPATTVSPSAAIEIGTQARLDEESSAPSGCAVPGVTPSRDARSRRTQLPGFSTVRVMGLAPASDVASS